MTRVPLIIMALGTAATLAACARQQPEPVFVEPAPIVAEPTFNKL